MFKVFRILARGAVARAEEEVFDRNAILILDQQIRETGAALERSRRALALAIAGDRAEERRLAEAEARIRDLEARACAALAAGRDDFARTGAEAIAEEEAEVAAIRTARARSALETGRLRAAVAEAGRRQAELERGRRLAAAAETVRRAGRAAGPDGLATLAEAEATLKRLRGLQAEAADADEAYAEITGSENAAETMERAGFGPRTRPNAEDVLARLRDRANATAAAGPA